MLVLSRRPGESIIIGNNLVKVKVLTAKDGAIRLGIDAPKHLSVHREEIYFCVKNGSLKSKTIRDNEKRDRKNKNDISYHPDDEDKGNK